MNKQIKLIRKWLSRSMYSKNKDIEVQSIVFGRDFEISSCSNEVVVNLNIELRVKDYNILKEMDIFNKALNKF